MNNDTLQRPTLEELLDTDLHNLINCTASKFYGTYRRRCAHSAMVTQEDLALEGYAAIAVAFQSFDPTMGPTEDMKRWFRTHAYPYIRNSMLTYVRKFGHPLSISEKAARDDLDEVGAVGVVHIDQFDEDEEFDIPVGSGVELTQDVDDYFFVGFTEHERTLMKEHILDGFSLQELAVRHKMSKSRAGEIIRELTDRMRPRAESYVKDN